MTKTKKAAKKKPATKKLPARPLLSQPMTSTMKNAKGKIEQRYIHANVLAPPELDEVIVLRKPRKR